MSAEKLQLYLFSAKKALADIDRAILQVHPSTQYECRQYRDEMNQFVLLCKAHIEMGFWRAPLQKVGINWFWLIYALKQVVSNDLNAKPSNFVFEGFAKEELIAFYLELSSEFVFSTWMGTLGQ